MARQHLAHNQETHTPVSTFLFAWGALTAISGAAVTANENLAASIFARKVKPAVLTPAAHSRTHVATGQVWAAVQNNKQNSGQRLKHKENAGITPTTDTRHIQPRALIHVIWSIYISSNHKASHRSKRGLLWEEAGEKNVRERPVSYLAVFQTESGRIRLSLVAIWLLQTICFKRQIATPPAPLPNIHAFLYYHLPPSCSVGSLLLSTASSN